MAITTSATIASIYPIPNDVRLAIQAYIQNPTYINREQIEYSKWHQIQCFLDNPELKPTSQVESRLRHRAYTEFQLTNNRLYRKPDLKFPNPRYLVPESEALMLLSMRTFQLLHGGQIKT